MDAQLTAKFAAMTKLIDKLAARVDKLETEISRLKAAAPPPSD